MPAKNMTKRPQHVIDEAVKRHLEMQEPVDKLIKHYKISRAAFYLWVKKYKQEVLDRHNKAGRSVASVEAENKADLVAENRGLREENAKLRNKLVSLLMKAGEL